MLSDYFFDELWNGRLLKSAELVLDILEFVSIRTITPLLFSCCLSTCKCEYLVQTQCAAL